MSTKVEKNHMIGLLVSILTFVIIAVFFLFTKILDGMELGALDFRYFLREPNAESVKLETGDNEGIVLVEGSASKSRGRNPMAREDIYIVGIDENTIRYMSDKGQQWPFHWNYHAQLTRNLGEGNPLAIFFDIMFLDHKEGEEELAEAIEQAKVAFLDFPFETKDVETDYTDQSLRNALWDQFSFPKNQADNNRELVEEAVPPTPRLIKAAKGIGFANVFPDHRDKVNRTMPLVLKYKDRYYPNIDLVIVMHYYGITREDVEIKMGEYIKLKNIPEIKRVVGANPPKDIMAKPNKERVITIPIDENGFMDVNFIGGLGSYDNNSYKTFLPKGILKNSKALENKIVLVAAYSSTGIATDIKKSPYGDTFGIEHHAHALNTILSQNFLYKLSELQNLLILLIISVLIGLVIPRISIVKAFVSTILFVILYIIGSFFVFEVFGVISALATPIIQTSLTFTTIISYRFMTEQKEKKYIRSTFSKFVSKSVVDDLLRHPDKLQLGGEKKVLTVLFSDIRGFTSISEKLTPEELVEHLNVYLQKMTDIVFKYDGTLDKYVGDEIMAFWGAPIPQEEHALFACRAALEMMEELNIMNSNWIEQGKPPLDIGIGLNSGDMVVGNMGSSSRMDYTLMGDNVNLGARLEGTNKVYKTNIIISEFTYALVKNNVIVRELDLIRVKGKELPVKIYELIDVTV